MLKLVLFIILGITEVPVMLRQMSFVFNFIENGYTQMSLHPDLPIYILTNPERFWLEQVFEWKKVGKKFSFEHVRVKLEGRIPNDFTYQEINTRLLGNNGTNITVLGILALEHNSKILEQIDKTALAIRSLIIENVDREDVDIVELSQITGIPVIETSFLIHILSLAGHFVSGGSMELEVSVYKSIRVSGSEKIFNNYICYPGIKKLILNDLKSHGPDAGNTFSDEEIYTANEKLDFILYKIEAAYTGNQLELLEIKNEINEMRNHYSLPKKNWWQMLKGKLMDMTLSGVVSETASKEIVSIFKNAIRLIGF